MIKRIAIYLLILFLAVVFKSPFSSQGYNRPASLATIATHHGTQIVMLGTGTPIADPERSGPALAIVVRDTPYLVDLGPGLVRRAAAAYKNGVSALAMRNLTRAFVTHLHSDHTVGYADLIFTPWVMGRVEPLEVYGPPGMRAMTTHILSAYSEDISIRVNGLEHANRDGCQVRTHEVKPGIIYKDKNVTVRAFRVNHGSWKEAFGYRFETADRIIVVSGDTAPTNSIVEGCNGCDVLIHEVYSQAGFAALPAAWQRYHSHFHTSSRELAQIATKARPGLLIVYHQLFWNTTEEDLLGEIRKGYSGNVVSAHDLDIY